MLLFGEHANGSTENLRSTDDARLCLEGVEQRQVLVGKANCRLLRHVCHLYVTSGGYIATSYSWAGEGPRVAGQRGGALTCRQSCDLGRGRAAGRSGREWGLLRTVPVCPAHFRRDRDRRRGVEDAEIRLAPRSPRCPRPWAR